MRTFGCGIIVLLACYKISCVVPWSPVFTDRVQSVDFIGDGFIYTGNVCFDVFLLKLSKTAKDDML